LCIFYPAQYRLDATPRRRYSFPVMSSNPLSFGQRLAAARAQMVEIDRLRKEAFQPAPAMPQPGAPPMDPAMMQQGMPMDPAMMQQQGMPMDPAMMQGAPPQMAPGAEAAPPSVPPEQLEEMMTLLEDMANGLMQMTQRVEALEQANQQLTQQSEEMMATLQSAMQPAPEGAQQAGGW
jgi:hypothetical protein